MCCDCQDSIIGVLRNISSQLDSIVMLLGTDIGPDLVELKEEVGSMHFTHMEFIERMTNLGLRRSNDDNTGGDKN